MSTVNSSVVPPPPQTLQTVDGVDTGRSNSRSNSPTHHRDGVVEITEAVEHPGENTEREEDSTEEIIGSEREISERRDGSSDDNAAIVPVRAVAVAQFLGGVQPTRVQNRHLHLNVELDAMSEMLRQMSIGFANVVRDNAAANQAVAENLDRLSTTTENVAARMDGLSRGQQELAGQVENINERLNNIAEIVRGLPADVARMSAELRELREQVEEEQSRQVGLQAPARGMWVRAIEEFNSMSLPYKCLAILGLIAAGIISYHLAIWAWPFIVTIVSAMGSGFVGLFEPIRPVFTPAAAMRVGAAFFNAQASSIDMGRFMEDPLIQQINNLSFGPMMMAFTVALIRALHAGTYA